MSSSRPQERSRRSLTPEEYRVKTWIRNNHGVLTRVAESCGVSVAFVNRIAYNQLAKSYGYKVEKQLLALGCPLIQRIK